MFPLGLFFVICAWLWYLDTPFVTIGWTALFLAFQALVGWQIIRNVPELTTLNTPAQIGLANAFGAVLFVIIDQATRLVLSGTLRNTFVLLSAGVISTFINRGLRWRESTSLKPEISRTPADTEYDSYGLAIIIVAVALVAGRGTYPPGRVMALLIILGCGFVVVLLPDLNTTSKFGLCFMSVMFAVGIASFFRPGSSEQNWVLEPLYHGSDDLIFSESLSYSLSEFGPQNVVAAFGSTLRYHWLSFAWAGLLGRISHAEPFVTTLHLVPVFGYLTIALLIFGAVRHFTRSRLAPFVSIVTLCLMAYPGISTRFIVVENTSNILGHVFLLATVLLILSTHASSGFLLRVFWVTMLIATWLTKPHYVILILLWLVLRVLVEFRDKPKLKQQIVELVGVGFSLLIAYLLFLRPHTWEQRSISFTISWFGLPKIGPLGFVSLTSALLIIALALFGSFLVLFNFQREHGGRLLPMLALATLLNGCLAIFVRGNSSDEYFLGASLTVNAVLIGVAIGALDIEGQKVKILIGVTAGLSFLTHWWLLEQWNGFTLLVAQNGILGGNLPASLKLAMPWLTVTFTTISSILICKKNPRSIGQPKVFFLRTAPLVIVVTSALLGAQIGTHLSLLNYGEPQTSFAPSQTLQALDWLRSNGEKDWLIATNRDLCTDPPECSQGGSSYLISAVAHLPVLIEGPRFVVGGQNYPPWVKDRISTSLQFAQLPNLLNHGKLIELGVTHFFFDKTSYPYLSNENMTKLYGRVLYTNSSVTIFQLEA